MKQFDYIVIGSGIAGLTFALKVAAHGRVAVVTKKHLAEANTQYAREALPQSPSRLIRLTFT